MNISLYFHIPFCRQKCPYCHFYSIPNQDHLHSVFLGALKIEWEQKLPLILPHQIVSIYFGGGTPSLFNVPEILSWIYKSNVILDPNCEITIEANPEKLDLTILKNLRQAGINRISIGVQSLDDDSLQILKRAHSAKKATQAIYDAQEAGFDNISIDLMYDLPHQSKKSWIQTLDALTDLPITHCSLYNLTIEPYTSFYRQKDTIQHQMPNEELSLDLLQTAIDRLEALFLHRYEISAFAKKGFHSIHNSGYWLGRPFLGFGPSAFSYFEGERFKNIAHLQRYAQLLRESGDIIEMKEKLPYPANVNELLAIQLRMMSGVDIKEWDLLQDTINNLEQLKTDGFIHQDGSRWKLTDKGTLFYDTVAEKIISDEVGSR